MAHSITIDTARISTALQSVAQVIERRNTIPILSHLRVEQSGGTVRIWGTDLDIMVKVALAPADSMGEFARCIEAHRLTQISKALAKGSQMTLKQDEDGAVKLSSGRSRYALPTLPVDDFPTITMDDDAVPVTMAAQAWYDILHMVALKDWADDTRYYLQGICLQYDGGNDDAQLKFTATNGHVLRRQVAANDCDAFRPIIIPKKMIAVILPMLDAMGDTPVTANISATKISWQLGDIFVLGKLIDGTFPDSDRVIPQGHDKQNSAIIDVPSVSAAVRRVMLIDDNRATATAFSFVPNELTISANGKGGVAHEVVACDFDGPPITIGMNGAYFQEMATALGSDTLAMSWSDAKSPLLLTVPARETVRAVIMPIRI